MRLRRWRTHSCGTRPNGKHSAVETDLELLRSGIRLMALRAIGDPDVADEVAQETMARAVEVLRCPEKTDSLGAYVAGIARHVIADHFRSKARTVSLEDVAQETLLDDVADPLAVLCSAGELKQVREALTTLSHDDRELVHLVYFDGLTPTELAQRMGVPPERIRQRKLRALQRLRTAFDGVTQSRHADASAPTEPVRITSGERRGSAA